jgi:hypothetical protein
MEELKDNAPDIGGTAEAPQQQDNALAVNIPTWPTTPRPLKVAVLHFSPTRLSPDLLQLTPLLHHVASSLTTAALQ